MTQPYIQQPTPEFNVGTQDAPTGTFQQVPPQTTTTTQAAQPFTFLTNPTGGSTVAGEQFFTADQLHKARQEEKDKLYKSLEAAQERATRMEEQLQTLLAERQADADARKASEQAQTLAVQKAAEEEMTAKELIATKELEFNARLAQFEAERQQERMLLQKDREFADLRAYIGQRAREESEAATIAPQLLDFIDGATREQIEERILVLRAKSDQILQDTQEYQQVQRSQMRGVSTAGYAATGPLEQEASIRNISHEELKNMPMSEWAKIRGQVIGGPDQSKQGLFG